MSYELIFNNKSKKNSGHCFLRTIYPREDGSYLISFQFSKTNMVEIFISSIFIFLTDILCVQVYSSTRGIEGFQLLYELSPSVIYCNGKINVISVVSCYIAIDGTEAYQIHGNSNFRSLCKLLSYIFRWSPNEFFRSAFFSSPKF
jgi:hypothetical protein